MLFALIGYTLFSCFLISGRLSFYPVTNQTLSSSCCETGFWHSVPVQSPTVEGAPASHVPNLLAASLVPYMLFLNSPKFFFFFFFSSRVLKI